MPENHKPFVVLLTGASGAGKSKFANDLRKELDFKRISGDRLYVRFIKEQIPFLYFPMLLEFIGDHYDKMVIEGMRKKVFRTNVKAQWLEFSADEIEDVLRHSSRVIAEGYTFKDITEGLKKRLEKSAKLIIIEMIDYKPMVNGNLTDIESIRKMVESVT